MKTALRISVLFFSVFIILNCGEHKTKNNSEAASSNSEIPNKKMCELLTKETMSEITGLTFNEEMTTLHQTDKSSGKYVSQCGYYTDSGNMGVLVRRFGNTSFPKTKEKLIGGPETGDADLDAMMHKAIETSKTVNDLGDAAFFYDLGGIYNLIVVFDDHYQAHITSYGKEFGFDDKSLEVSNQVAEKVISIFK